MPERFTVAGVTFNMHLNSDFPHVKLARVTERLDRHVVRMMKRARLRNEPALKRLALTVAVFQPSIDIEERKHV